MVKSITLSLVLIAGMDAFSALQIFPDINASFLRCISVSASQDCMILRCENITHADAIALYADNIAPVAIGMGFRKIQIKVGHRIVHQFPCSLPLRLMEKKIMGETIAIFNPRGPTIQAPDRVISVVRMSDHKGLWSAGDVQRTSGVNPNDWIGEDMSRWWIDDSLKRFCEALDTHRRVTSYSYKALLMTGEPRQYVVNAELILFREQLCRKVEVMSCDPV